MKHIRIQQGFTLIELMVAVAVLAILSAWAFPNYVDHVATGRLPEAHGALADYKNQMEQHYFDRRTYQNTAGTACGIAIPVTTNFTIACSSADADSFTATATAISGKNIDGFVFSINNTGTKITVPGTSATAVNCWSRKKNGAC